MFEINEGESNEKALLITSKWKAASHSIYSTKHLFNGCQLPNYNKLNILRNN